MPSAWASERAKIDRTVARSDVVLAVRSAPTGISTPIAAHLTAHLRQPELDSDHGGGGQQHGMREDDAVDLAVKAQARQQTQQRHAQYEQRYQDRKDQNRRRQDSAGKDEPVERVRREEADDRGCRRRARRDQEAVQQRVEEDPVLHQLAVPLERPALQRERGIDVLLEREEDQKRDRKQQEDEAEKEIDPARDSIAALVKIVTEPTHRHAIRCVARSAMRYGATLAACRTTLAGGRALT